MLRDIPHLYLPDLPLHSSTGLITPAITTTSLAQAIGWRSPRAGNIKKVGSRWGTVSGTNTATFALRDCTSNSTPDGVNDQTGISITPTSNTMFVADFTISPRPVVMNEAVALVIGGSVVGGSFQLSTNSVGMEQNSVWTATFNGSTWAGGGGSPPLWVQYTDDVIAYIPGAWPGLRSTQTFATNTNPNECLMRFRVPQPMRLAGIRFYFMSGFSAVFDAKAYTDAMSLLATGTRGGTRGAGSPIDVYFNTPVTLSGGVWYRVAILPTTTTGVIVPFFDAPSVVEMGASPGGPDFYWGTRQNAGAVTDINTRRPSISLIIDQMDDGITSPTDISAETLIIQGDQSMM